VNCSAALGAEQESCSGWWGTRPLRRPPGLRRLQRIESESRTTSLGFESERLGRRYFSLFKQGELDRLLALCHPDVEVVLKSVRPGDVVRGRQAFEALATELLDSYYEAVPEVFRPLDAERLVVEGRVRWMDDERVLRDDPMIWAIEFRDGLVFRSTPARSVAEAEAILAAPR
jgi:ketosteroid isomerase-like protein